MKYLYKICTIYVTPPNDTERVLSLLKDTFYYVAEGYDENGKFKYDVFDYRGSLDDRKYKT